MPKVLNRSVYIFFWTGHWLGRLTRSAPRVRREAYRAGVRYDNHASGRANHACLGAYIFQAWCTMLKCLRRMTGNIFTMDNRWLSLRLLFRVKIIAELVEY